MREGAVVPRNTGVQPGGGCVAVTVVPDSNIISQPCPAPRVLCTVGWADVWGD